MLILASASPRRSEILRYFSVPFIVVPSEFDENSIEFNNDPKNYVCRLAEEKAKVVKQKYPNDVILSADTIVYCQNKVYNKPANKNEALIMLNELSGSWHHVFTAVCVLAKESTYLGLEETKILFHPLTKDQMENYLQNCYFTDKAGGFAIQQSGSIVVKKMEGCYYNVMGLPINMTRELLYKAGIDLWNFLKPC
ncbi:MAG: septum formation protein Maf [Chlamydiae bacterium]|nr:septum formation protein Maf [Chlamydiota bacterium]